MRYLRECGRRESGELGSLRETECRTESPGATRQGRRSRSGWSGLEAVDREGEDSLRWIIGYYALGVTVTFIFNDQYIFGEELFFPDGAGGW